MLLLKVGAEPFQCFKFRPTKLKLFSKRRLFLFESGDTVLHLQDGLLLVDDFASEALIFVFSLQVLVIDELAGTDLFILQLFKLSSVPSFQDLTLLFNDVLNCHLLFVGYLLVGG